MVALMGSLRVANVGEKIVVEVKVPEAEEPGLTGFLDIFAFRKEEKPKPPKNEVKAEVFKKMGREKLTFALGQGNYARFLEIGGRLFFQHSTVEYQTWKFEERGPTLLPSSSVNRKELDMIKGQQFDVANQWGYQRARQGPPAPKGG